MGVPSRGGDEWEASRVLFGPDAMHAEVLQLAAMCIAGSPGPSTMDDEDGEVAISTTYVGGKKNGRYREWKRKGDTRLLHVEGEYTDGEKDGVWTVYDDAGHPIELTTWVMGAIKK